MTHATFKLSTLSILSIINFNLSALEASSPWLPIFYTSFILHSPTFSAYKLIFIYLFFSSFLSKQIDNLLLSSKIPIIVGGTNYYIESILWHNLVSPGIGKRKKVDDVDIKTLSGLEQEVKDFIADPSMLDKMNGMESSKLHEYLKLIDSKMANRIHPNNKRKIIRWVLLDGKLNEHHFSFMTLEQRKAKKHVKWFLTPSSAFLSDVNNLAEHTIRCQNTAQPLLNDMAESKGGKWKQ